MDMFASAPTTTAAPKGKAKKASKPELNIGLNLDVLAAADAVAKTLKGVQEAYGTMVKSVMSKHFALEGSVLGRRPENVKLIGNQSDASGELRKRDERRLLCTEEAEKLQAKGVAVEKKILTPEKFMFDDDFLANQEDRDLMSAFIAKNFGGRNPIRRQEEVSGYIVVDQSMDDAFNGKTTDEAEELEQIVGTLAIKPKFNGTLRQAMEVLDNAGVSL